MSRILEEGGEMLKDVDLDFSSFGAEVSGNVPGRLLTSDSGLGDASVSANSSSSISALLASLSPPTGVDNTKSAATSPLDASQNNSDSRSEDLSAPVWPFDLELELSGSAESNALGNAISPPDHLRASGLPESVFSGFGAMTVSDVASEEERGEKGTSGDDGMLSLFFLTPVF